MRHVAVLLLLSLAAASPTFGGVFRYSDQSRFDPFIVVHPPGYTGASGELAVKICAVPGSQTVIPALRQAIEIWNLLEPITENCEGNCLLWEEPAEQPAPLSMTSVLLHELGHCALGLGHVNLPTTSFTNSRDSISIDPGIDGVRGSADDVPSPLPGTRVIHWFRKNDNHPFVIDSVVVDGNTYARRILDLPSGHSWPASGNRGVGEFLGLNTTHAVMYDAISDGQFFRGIIADEVSTVKFAMSGLDFEAGTGDDYTVRLLLQADCSTADIQVEFGIFPELDGAPAACISDIQYIETIHYRLAPDPLLFDRLVIWVDSSQHWDIIFHDGFESGTTSAWSATTR